MTSGECLTRWLRIAVRSVSQRDDSVGGWLRIAVRSVGQGDEDASGCRCLDECAYCLLLTAIVME